MKHLLIAVFLACCFAQCVEAAEQESWDREGFFLGLTFGPGKLFSDDIDRLSKYSEGIWSDFRIGAGITEKFLIFAETGVLVIPQNGENSLDTQHFVVAGQYFLTEHAYGKLGIGLGYISGSSLKDNDVYDQGLAIVGGGGYECRLGKRFAISGSGGLRYQESDLLSGITVSLDLGFLWYF